MFFFCYVYGCTVFLVGRAHSWVVQCTMYTQIQRKRIAKKFFFGGGKGKKAVKHNLSRKKLAGEELERGKSVQHIQNSAQTGILRCIL